MEARANELRPSGPVAAVLLASGIGAVVLGGLTIAAEASESFANSLAYDLEVGPLSGKTIWATAAFLVSWAALTAGLRKRDVNLGTVGLVTAVLVALALVATFAPFFQLFAPD
jgi:hypothetical protein